MKNMFVKLMPTVMLFGAPIPPAVYHYQQEHGERAYQQLLRRLFAELFPAD
jgi:hypothetical protein